MARLLRYGELSLVLLSCLSNGPRSAYQLMSDVEQLFGGRYKPSTGTLYPAVAGLETAELIAPDEGVFALTTQGSQVLREREADLAAIAERTGAHVLPEDGTSRRLRQFAATVRDLVSGLDVNGVEAVLAEATECVQSAVKVRGRHA